jgi:rsbT co-antagonist protein RsbR
MGAECIISGVRPQIAQTIVHLGINLEEVVTKAKLSDALALALDRSGRVVVRKSSAPANPISNFFSRKEG